MAGTAKTNTFMLGTATVMLGAPEDLYNLNPDEHSIGLVKNFTLTSEPAYIELSQGVKNQIVYSVMNSNPVRATMEAYEFTAKNLAYALGIEGADTVTTQTVETTLASAIDGVPAGEDQITVTSATGITAGKYIMIAVNGDDDIIVRKVSSVASNVLTLDVAIERDVAAGAKVKVVNGIGVGSKDEQPFYAAKIAGVLADGSKVVIDIPKVRIVRGFNLNFSTENYGNLPIELTVYDLVSTDAKYADFRNESARIYQA